MVFHQPPPVTAKEIPEITKYIKNGGYALAQNGKINYSANATTPFVPASTIKLLTGLAALNILGPDHRFHTKFFIDRKQNLYIQGFGDPFLVSEKVARITKHIATVGITRLNHIILDDYSFGLEYPPDGSTGTRNPYDVNCSALGVNFNALPLRVYHHAKIKSLEPQTPFLPLMSQIGSELTSGSYRVNVDALARQQTIPNRLLYCGELFSAFLTLQGISLTGNILHGQVPEEAKLLLDYVAPETPAELVQSCLLSSNNFMANQLFLALGVKRFGWPATWQKSQRAMGDFIQYSLKLREDQITVVEGSGLSTKNKISPEAMVQVLEQFKGHASLIPTKYGVRMKSGTLYKTGVFCYAGYLSGGKNNNAFVILLNQKKNHRDAILKILSKY